MSLEGAKAFAKEASLDLKVVNEPLESARVFSVCTLLRRPDSYERLLRSFLRFGFTAENTEFIVADNTEANIYDGYEITRRLLPECKGKYIVCTHDDVELVDEGFGELLAALQELDFKDPYWCVAGVAGGIQSGPKRLSKKLVLRISDVYGIRRDSGHPLPTPVSSVDECFYIMPRERAIFGSLDLSGFHFYGTDICLQARLAGGTSYVIPFHLMHHGLAKRDATFQHCFTALRRKYAPLLRGEYIHTTTVVIPLVADLHLSLLNLTEKIRRRLLRIFRA